LSRGVADGAERATIATRIVGGLLRTKTAPAGADISVTAVIRAPSTTMAAIWARRRP
jgi:hypothetical protein